MADRRDRLSRIEKGTHECDGLRQGAQLIRIGDAAGKQQGIEEFGVSLVEHQVDGKFVRLVEVLPSLNVPFGG